MAHAAAALRYAFVASLDEFLYFDCDWTLIMDRSSLAAHPAWNAAPRNKAAPTLPRVDRRLLEPLQHPALGASRRQPKELRIIPGNTPLSDGFPMCRDTSSPSTSRKSVVSARSRPS